MPDISKLPELAKIFGVTIDELLSEKSEILENIVRGEFTQYLESNEIMPEELREIAPLLKPAQFNEAFKNIKKINLTEVGNLLPFLDGETIDKLALEAAEENADGLGGVAPFISRNTSSAG